MPKYVFLLATLWLASCSTDPLAVRTVETNEAVVTDGLDPLSVHSETTGWTETEEVWTATGPATLELLPSHQSLTLSLSFQLEAGAQARLLLNNTYALELPSLTLDDTTELNRPVAITPGIWQDLEVTYQSARNNSPPLLLAAYLNGNLLYYQQPLTGEGTGDGPLVLQLDSGSMSVTNLRTADRAGRSSSLADDGSVDLSLPLIHYAYYEIEGDPEDVTNYGTLTPVKEGYISRFDLGGIHEKSSGYAVRFDSELHIPKAKEYTFRLWTPSSTRLYIDDQLVVDLGGRTDGLEGEGTIRLSEGDHQLRLDYYQFGTWNRLDVKYLGEDGTVKSLNDMPEGQAIATPTTPKVMEIETDDRPYLLRSFMNFPPAKVYDYTDKRTHVVSVGEARGPHYSYDLHNGSLLQAWRGKFLDVGDMWINRGEPQVARALGNVIAFDGRPQWSEESDQWPDSLAALHHLRHELDDAGRPTFFYALDGEEVSDRIVPENDGLSRTLTNLTGGETLLTQVIAARSIRETAPGTFELQGPGATVQITDLAAGGLRLLQSAGSARLVAEIPPGEHVTYHIDF